MERYELPENWAWRMLGELADISAGTSAPQGEQYFSDGKYPFVRTQDVGKYGRTTCLKNTADKVNDKAVSEKKLRKAKRGSIVLPKSGASILTNSRAILGVDAYIVSHLAILEPNVSLLDSFYLYYWLCIIDMTSFSQSDSGYPSLRLSDIAKIEIPTPPLSEQRRIVKRIEELTKRVEETRQLRKSTIEEAEKYILAAIASVFGDGQNHGWVAKKISEICEKPQYGYTESACHAAVGPKFLRITDIQDGKVEWDKVPYCKCDDVDKYRLRTGDIVFARTGATTGKSYLIKNPPKAIFASYLIRLRVGPLILPEFLYWHFQSSTYWASVSSGIDEGNRPNMNGTKLANIEVSYPKDKAEQNRIVEYLNSLQTKAEELKHLQAKTETELEAFTPALLSKAFRGEL